MLTGNGLLHLRYKPLVYVTPFLLAPIACRKSSWGCPALLLAVIPIKFSLNGSYGQEAKENQSARTTKHFLLNIHRKAVNLVH